ncbi:MAG: hypothetical protein MSG64_09295 [Pyrinomonadaceae bacterium MAG19_C2-C3]|nr:hypothetical protein [Pyrinomonadaceae bacterium MAG19_C2-C3]
MQTLKVKEQAQRLIDELPDDATWDDLMHRIYVRQAIDAGLADSRNGRVVSHDEAKRRLGLTEPQV